MLVVDESLHYSMQLKNILKSLNDSFTVDISRSFESAVTNIKDNDYDLITIDVELEDRSGLELISHIEENEKGQKTWVVIISGHREQMLDAYHNFGVNKFICKPFITDEVTNVVYKLLSYNIQMEERKEIRIREKDIKMNIVVDDIEYIDIVNRKAIIHLTSKNEINLGRKSLGSFLEENDFEQFFRCYKSIVANLDNVSSLVRDDGMYFFKLKSGDLVPISSKALKELELYDYKSNILR